MKVEFHYAHYTRTFRKKAVLAEEGTLAIELRDADLVDKVMRNVFLRVLHRLQVTEKPTYKPFGSCGFIHTNSRIDASTHIWEKELGRKGEGDFIRITATFPPEIQKRYKKEWDDYMDALSMPEV